MVRVRRPLYPGGRHWCLPRLGLLLQLRRRMSARAKPALRVAGHLWDGDTGAGAVGLDAVPDGRAVSVAETVGNGPKGGFTGGISAEVVGLLPLMCEGPFPAGAGQGGHCGMVEDSVVTDDLIER